MAKILVIDIETAPKLAYVWRFYKENISPKQVKEHGSILSFAAKWLGNKSVIYSDVQTKTEAQIVQEMIDLLSEADVVVAHNAKKFDIPMIIGRALVLGIAPPSPFKVVDTLLEARRLFGMPSNSLEYLALILGCTAKDGHKEFPGFELWKECLANNPKAWKEMKVYNIQDIDTLEEIYLKMRPFMNTHPNLGVLNDWEEPQCPKCGGHHLVYRGYATTNVGKYRRFVCNDCGGWGRTRFLENTKEKRRSLVTNA